MICHLRYQMRVDVVLAGWPLNDWLPRCCAVRQKSGVEVYAHSSATMDYIFHID